MSELGGVLVVLALATLLATLLAGAISPPPRRADEPAAAAFRRTAMLFALALETIFCAQELTEGALAVGHPAGLAGVHAHGGWVFAPLALAIGALCSLICLVLRGVERALACITRPRRVPRRPVSLPQPNFATARRPLVLLNLGGALVLLAPVRPAGADRALVGDRDHAARAAGEQGGRRAAEVSGLAPTG